MKKIGNKIVAFLKNLLGKTNIDDKALERILDLGIKKFMEHYGDKTHRASQTFIDKVQGSIKMCISESGNKVDDLFVPFIDRLFNTLTTKVVGQFLVKDNIELTLKNFKSFIINKYAEGEAK